jgi:hypothetical protein
MIFGLDNSFQQDVGFLELGITPEMFKDTVALLKGFYNLMPKNTFNVLKDKPFMKAIHERIEAEKHGKQLVTGTVLDILPQPTETCMPHFITRDEFCNFRFVDMSDSGSIEDKRITKDSVHSLLERYAAIDGAKEIYESVEDDLFDLLKNPGVQVNILFSSVVPTVSKFDFDEDPSVKTRAGAYIAPTEEHFSYGDGSVLVTSAITPGLKWGEDFNNKVAGAKPATIIEVCSIYKRRTSVFEEGTLYVTKNAYFGIECDCGGTTQ